MRRVGLLVLVWSLLIVQAVAAAGSVKIDDPDKLLGNRRGEVDHAAQQLAAKGADVVVMTVRNDDGNPQDALSDLPYINQRLASSGIVGTTNNLPGNTILFFRSTESGHSGIYYVPGYKSKLDPAINNIFQTKMRPLFTTNDIAGGMVAGIDAVRTVLYPPTSPFTYGAIGIVVLGALVLVLGPQLSKRRLAASALSEARSRVTSARNTAGAAIADLGQALRTAQAKAQYDKFSYTPADFQRITELQSRGEQVFVEAQSSFDQAELDQNTAEARPTIAMYQHVAEEYEHARALTEQAAAAIQEAERLRTTLDHATAQTTSATGPTQRL